MKRARQFSLDRYLPKHQRRRIAYGGDQSRGTRKIRRPLDPRRPLHLVLRSSLAKGERSFLKTGTKHFVHDALQAAARKFGIRVLEWANVGNHIHLVIRFREADNVGRFLRAFCAKVSMRQLGVRKGESCEQVLKAKRRFWDATPFSRIVYERLLPGFGLLRYLRKNQFEGLGWDARSARMLAAQLPPEVELGPAYGVATVPLP